MMKKSLCEKEKIDSTFTEKKLKLIASRELYLDRIDLKFMNTSMSE